MDLPGQSLSAELSHAGLESSSNAVVEDLDRRLSQSSVGVALRLIRKARWVSSIIHATTYCTHEDLPLFGEAVEVLLCSSMDLYTYAIARLSDVDIAEEELAVVLPRVHERWRREDETEESADLLL